MSLFQQVKEHLNLIDVAKYYGIKVNRRDFTSCLFHNERTPSLKLYHDHFHCFGCGKTGDVIALVAQMLNLSQVDSAKVLMNDFRLSHEEFRLQAKPQIQPTYSEWERQTIRLLNEYLAYLQHFKTLYTPKFEHEPINTLFVESLHAIPRIEYYLDILTFEPLAVRKQFLQEFMKQLDEIEIKLDEYKRTHPVRGGVEW
ncbi:CHC2 zinc finger domain-containing protein [Anaerotignum sp.]|uniref:CHC2 zinc finger domain-containing protein n=1 Tax=Anaerotignum sp. TaxID=2039241 RepID=UPI0028ABD1F4|nr:CHC2 zinc finger domain-containing protein [Anaerotignum sp.]